MDLACSSDCLTSFLMVQSEASDRALNALRIDYMQWCVDSKVDQRAVPKLFTVKALKTCSTEYASVSQKLLKGSACRMMCYWACGLAMQRASENPADVHSQISGSIVFLRLLIFAKNYKAFISYKPHAIQENGQCLSWTLWNVHSYGWLWPFYAGHRNLRAACCYRVWRDSYNCLLAL